MIPTEHYWSDDLAAAARHKGYSQYGEEGVIAKLFADLGTTDRYLLDIGAGDGKALSNTKALLEAGWHGARFDVAYGADVYQERITAENVCDVCARYNVPNDLDLLSLDIDGIDWYVLRALLRGGYRPRVMVCECNPCIPAEPAVAVVYHPGFVFGGTRYFGASLAAFRKLAEAYGYTLVHLNESVNGFFVRSELLPPGLKVSIEHRVRASWPPDARQWHTITAEDLP